MTLPLPFRLSVLVSDWRSPARCREEEQRRQEAEEEARRAEEERLQEVQRQREQVRFRQR